MADEKASSQPVTCTGKATCECLECGPRAPDWRDELHRFLEDPIEGTCSLCDEEEESEIHVKAEEFKDPALTEEDIAGQIPPPIASETTTGDLTHVVLQWGSKYHMLRKGKREGSPVPLTQPCFLSIGGETFMALSNLFSAQGIYKVEKLK